MRRKFSFFWWIRLFCRVNYWNKDLSVRIRWPDPIHMDYSYTHDQLCALNRNSLRPKRSVRKVLFRSGLWLSAQKRRERETTEFCARSSMNDYRTIESVVLDQMRPGTPEPVTSSPRTTVDQGKHKQISFGLLNCRSVGNKYSTIYSEILDRKLDACLLTETWHQSNQDTALKRCVPPGYNLHDVPRPTSGAVQNHGGIAAIVSSEFVVEKLPFTGKINIA